MLELLLIVGVFFAGYGFRGQIAKETKVATAELKSVLADLKLHAASTIASKL